MREPQPLFKDLPITFFIARPSRWQLWRAQLWLLLFAPRAKPGGALTLLGLAGLAAAEFFFSLTMPDAVLGLSSLGRLSLGLFGLVAVGWTVLLATWRARGDLEAQERDGGSLVGLGPRQFVWTERGSTLVCSWDLVQTHDSPLGLIFELPWRRLCLLPYDALETPAGLGPFDLRAIGAPARSPP